MKPVVIFDLWRTLVPLDAAHKEAAMAGLAAALGEDTPEFRRMWRDTRRARETRSLPVYLAELRAARAASWTPEQIRLAMANRFDAHYRAFDGIRPQARPTLTALRKSGFHLGLVSNCSSDVRAMLEAAGLLPLFDSVTLSAEAGCMKPDPRIFELALNSLGASSGFYVGDGDDGELAGARAAGLTDVLLDLDEGRTGSLRIAQLTDVLNLVPGGHA